MLVEVPPDRLVSMMALPLAENLHRQDFDITQARIKPRFAKPFAARCLTVSRL
jgi:hypothetical protein